MEARSRGVETAAPRDRLGGVGADRPARSDPGARRRNAPAAARLPDAAAPGALDARRDAGREAALVRRGIPSALRRRRTGEHGRALPASPRRAGPRAPRARRLRDPPRALRSVPEGLHDPERQGGRRLPGGDRVEFERAKLYPLAGLDPARAEEFDHVRQIVDRLAYAGNEAARRYINGEIDAGGAARWLAEYALYPRDRAEQRMRFIDQYRSYVINYNLGKDLVRRFVESHGGTPAQPEMRREVFEMLMSSPRLPSQLT